MKSLIIKKILIGILVVSGLTLGLSVVLSRNSISEHHLGILKPTDTETPFVTSEIESDKEFVYEGLFGTEIRVPANAFADKEGNPVKGKVDFKVREIHGLKDVFLSGITMQSASGDEVMQSSGMIEVRAFQKGDTLQLAKGKELEIKLAATGDPDENYSLFYLENDRSWSEPMEYEIVKDNTNQSKLDEMDKMDLESDSVFEIYTAYEGRPFLRMWEDVKWQVFNCTGELPYTEVKDVIWDYVHVKPLDEKRKLFSLDMVSTMHNYNGVTKQYQTEVVARPVLSDLDLAAIQRKGEEIETELARQVKALFEQERKDAERVEKEMKKWEPRINESGMSVEQRAQDAINAFDKQLKREQDLYQKQMSRAALFSKFSANMLGIWNIDCLNGVDWIEFYCGVQIDGKVIDQQDMMSFLILEDLGSVIRLPPGEICKVPVREDKCSVIVIYDDGWIGHIKSDEYDLKVKRGDTSEKLEGERLDNETLDKRLNEINGEFVDQWRAKFS